MRFLPQQDTAGFRLERLITNHHLHRDSLTHRSQYMQGFGNRDKPRNNN